jgi:molybdopterin/thiamine biosynthesis adenylyltransferase
MSPNLEIEFDFDNNCEDRFARQKVIEWWNQELLESINVLVVGAGTLGNEVCKNLALLGVCNITVIDNDSVEKVNLSRSILMRNQDCGRNKAIVVAERMKELYDPIKVNALNLDVVYEYGNANFKDFDIVIMTVDNLEARIEINRNCQIWEIPLIDGGLDGLLCNVQVIIPSKTSCFECLLGQADYLRVKNKYSCIGLRRSILNKKIPMVITSASIAGGLMTQEAMKIIHDMEPTLAGKKAYIDGNNNNFEIFTVPINKNCKGHRKFDKTNIISINYNNNWTIGEIKNALSSMIPEDLELRHNKGLFYGAHCPNCGSEIPGIKPLGMLDESIHSCKECNSSVKLDTEITGLLRYDELPLKNYGIPNNNILLVTFDNGIYRYLVPATDRKET